MAQTKEGAAKAVATIKQKYGEDHFQKIGAIGGKKGTTGGFKDHELAVRAGRLGGLKSRRS